MRKALRLSRGKLPFLEEEIYPGQQRQITRGLGNFPDSYKKILKTLQREITTWSLLPNDSGIFLVKKLLLVEFCLARLLCYYLMKRGWQT
jgi:hypothetical protein